MEGTLAEIRIFGGNFAPRNWAFCDGTLLSIASNQALFSLLGTIYGGDGRTTFALPDLRSRVPIGEGNGPGLFNVNQAQNLGSETNTITNLQMPTHNHQAVISGSVRAPINTGTPNDSDDPSGQYFQAATDDTYSESPNTSLARLNLNVSATVMNNGGQQPMNNIQPFNTCNYIICLQGVFPSRS
ncbi:MAG: tail fiber protein [Bacteroidota bacterium]